MRQADMWQVVSASLSGRCPRCWRGGLFAGLLATRPRCLDCDLNLEPLTAEDGPAFFAICIIAAVAMPLVLVVEFTYAPPYWLHLVIWPPAVVIGSVVLLRPIKAFLMIQKYRNRAGDSMTDGQPRD